MKKILSLVLVVMGTVFAVSCGGNNSNASSEQPAATETPAAEGTPAATASAVTVGKFIFY